MNADVDVGVSVGVGVNVDVDVGVGVGVGVSVSVDVDDNFDVNASGRVNTAAVKGRQQQPRLGHRATPDPLRTRDDFMYSVLSLSLSCTPWPARQTRVCSTDALTVLRTAGPTPLSPNRPSTYIVCTYYILRSSTGN